MSDLVVTSHTPVLGSGRALRTYGVIRALALRGHVDVAFPWFGADSPAPEYERLEDVTLHGVQASRGPLRAVTYTRARVAGVPPGFARGISPDLVRLARRLAATPGRGRVIADGPTIAAALWGLPDVIYNSHNLESAFRHDAGDTDLGSRAALEGFERRLLEHSAESWMASPADMAGAAELAPGARLRYVPNVVDVQAMQPVKPAAEARAVFVADFGYGPNAEGLEWLLQEVYPRVWEQRPDARIALVGRGLTRVGHDERIEALGFVDDLRRDAYARAACVVVPLLEGGGSPLKFVEAMAYGLPVVATPKAAAGLEAVAGVHYAEGDGADGFAAALVEVFEHGAAEIAARGRALAEERYSVEALSEMIAA